MKNSSPEKPMNINSQAFSELAEICNNLLFWETDADLNITFINQAILEQTGISKNQIIGKKLLEIIHPEDSDGWKKVTGTTTTYKELKCRVITPSGQVTHLIISGKAIWGNDKILGYFGICTLETRNIIAKKTIQRLQTNNKTILRSLSEAVIIVDERNRAIVVSPTFYKMWRLEKEQVYLGTLSLATENMQEMLSLEYQNINLNLSQNFNSLKRTKDSFKLKDGRIIERKSFPHLHRGEIIGKCWLFKDISKQSSLIEKLGKLAFRDSLTKLYNRRWCEKKLKQCLRSKQDSLSFLYMDLDHFKVINDSCGHIHGDDVLAEVGRLLLKTIGEKAYLARLGGDEFGLILNNKSNSEVLVIAENIKNTITEYTYQNKNKIFKLGISIGIVFVKNEDDFRSVFVHADEACYVSKETGRNKCTVYNVAKAEFLKTQTELKWYDAIQKALIKGDFELWYQPIRNSVSAGSHNEILLRMRSENNEIISPDAFMGSADRFGMIVTIDKLVIESFCQFYQKNQTQLKNYLFSINISGHSISRDSFLPYVLNCLDKYSINGQTICFELTENEIIKNLDKALIFIKQVRELGCKISLDDFGKGLTSFSYLKNIPYDYIKIDGQFIKEINDNKINTAIIKSIVYIAEVMEKETIAEHIESEEILTQVAALGVDYFQGNYFSEPHQITKLLE
jgi:diguanylate cyclase (GGDEF)-like protein/PAS domain S-box-containing protein